MLGEGLAMGVMLLSVFVGFGAALFAPRPRVVDLSSLAFSIFSVLEMFWAWAATVGILFLVLAAVLVVPGLGGAIWMARLRGRRFWLSGIPPDAWRRVLEIVGDATGREGSLWTDAGMPRISGQADFVLAARPGSWVLYVRFDSEVGTSEITRLRESLQAEFKGVAWVRGVAFPLSVVGAAMVAATVMVVLSIVLERWVASIP
jgi:hypothetical protein